jgi:hypothetical protein
VTSGLLGSKVSFTLARPATLTETLRVPTRSIDVTQARTGDLVTFTKVVSSTYMLLVIKSPQKDTLLLLVVVVVEIMEG